MAELVADCPRCRAKRITFDLVGSINVAERYGWQMEREAFCVCRHCHRGIIFVVVDNDIPQGKTIAKHGLTNLTGAVNGFVDVKGHISLRHEGGITPPDHLPAHIRFAFEEGATCAAVECFNAAGTMFRLCVDMATKPLLPPDGEEPNAWTRRNLGPRLRWLLDNQKLPEDLRDLSMCIREDGNDGAHVGTLNENDSADLIDLTRALLERIYTAPARLQLAKERREARRAKV